MATDPWATLGLEPGADIGAVRRAYAHRLKALDQQRDLAAFQALRQAYEHALELCRSAPPVLQPAPPAPVAEASEGAAADAAPQADGTYAQARLPAHPPGSAADPTAWNLAVHIASLCTPVNFHPPAVRDFLATSAFDPLGRRAAVGALLADFVADGVTFSPHAIVFLDREFGWSDVNLDPRDCPAVLDPKFQQRLAWAQSGSRPSTRQHQTSPAPTLGLGFVLVYALNVLVNSGASLPRGGRQRGIESTLDLAMLSVGGVALALLLCIEAWAWFAAKPPLGRRGHIVARVVLGLAVVVVALYWVGRP